VPVGHPSLFEDARTLAKLVKDFGTTLPHVFMKLKDETTFVQAQLVHERIADIAIDLYVSSCVMARLDDLLGSSAGTSHVNGATKTGEADPYADVQAGRTFLAMAFRRIRQNFAALAENDDPAWLAAAASIMTKFRPQS
jgi:hypothetical protein